ncbi:hypothetical protein DFH09DRAFT_1379496 [Mycena vulgaris]|nr:hypothetical protein DFH09DRAFT_1379496 [Mycena vulgaris]
MNLILALLTSFVAAAAAANPIADLSMSTRGVSAEARDVEATCRVFGFFCDDGADEAVCRSLPWQCSQGMNMPPVIANTTCAEHCICPC